MDRPRVDEPIPEWAERMVRFLDDGFVVPGTTFRVGFDAVLGLVPGIGDFVTTATGLSLVRLAEQRGLPRSVVVRMLANLGIDALIGAVPFLGDAFDLVFKANRRNLELLKRYDRAPDPTATAPRMNDKLFVALVVAAVIVLLTVPITLAILIVRLLLD